jgi:hypothetical protein
MDTDIKDWRNGLLGLLQGIGSFAHTAIDQNPDLSTQEKLLQHQTASALEQLFQGLILIGAAAADASRRNEE